MLTDCSQHKLFKTSSQIDKLKPKQTSVCQFNTHI